MMATGSGRSGIVSPITLKVSPSSVILSALRLQGELCQVEMEEKPTLSLQKWHVLMDVNSDC